MYFNTTQETGETLQSYRDTADTQEQAVLAFFQCFPGPWRPDDIHRLLFAGSVPLTSVRRAMTNLTTEGHLAKTGIKRWGDMGRRVHTWALAGRKVVKARHRRKGGAVQLGLF